MDKIIAAVTTKRRAELQKFAEFLAVNGVRNNTTLENLHVELDGFTDERMRELMLSVERAIEVSLLTYESMTTKDRVEVLDFNETKRTYDLPEPLYTGVGFDKYQEQNQHKNRLKIYVTLLRVLNEVFYNVSKTAKWRKLDKSLKKVV